MGQVLMWTLLAIAAPASAFALTWVIAGSSHGAPRRPGKSTTGNG